MDGPLDEFMEQLLGAPANDDNSSLGELPQLLEYDYSNASMADERYIEDVDFSPLLDNGNIPPDAVKAGVNVNDESVYIGRVMEYNPKSYFPGVITPSDRVITYCDYRADKISLKTSDNFEVLLCNDDKATFYWKPYSSDKHNRCLPDDIKLLNPGGSPQECCHLFFAQIDASVVHTSSEVGCYTAADFPADFNGTLVGVGKAWYKDVNKSDQIENYTVHVPYNGRILEASDFSFLCFCKLPQLSYVAYPSVDWVTFGDNNALPPNAFAGGIAENGETLYVARKLIRGAFPETVPGYVVPSTMQLHICTDTRAVPVSIDYSSEILCKADFEWHEYSHGEIPPDAVTGGTAFNIVDKYYIGRTVTGSDITVGKTSNEYPISLTKERDPNMQLIGKIFPRDKCMYVAWNGEAYMYTTYEVLVMKASLKSLQRLCFDAIIAATAGVSEKIDQLPLPNHLKRFCIQLV